MRVDEAPQPEEVIPLVPQQPCVIQELDCILDGKKWEDGMVGSVIHECCVSSVIQEYGNFKATLSTPQYRFQKGMKGMKIFKEQGYKATVKELDKNLIGRNVRCDRHFSSMINHPRRDENIPRLPNVSEKEKVWKDRSKRLC